MKANLVTGVLGSLWFGLFSLLGKEQRDAKSGTEFLKSGEKNMRKILWWFYITSNFRAIYEDFGGNPEFINMEHRFTKGVITTTFEKSFWRFYKIDKQTIERF